MGRSLERGGMLYQRIITLHDYGRYCTASMTCGLLLHDSCPSVGVLRSTINMVASSGNRRSYSAILLFLVAAGECGKYRASQVCERI